MLRGIRRTFSQFDRKLGISYICNLCKSRTLYWVKSFLVYGMQFAACNMCPISSLCCEVEAFIREFARRMRHGTDSGFRC